MIMHKEVQEEVKALKASIEAGGVEVPDFWRCTWPGLVIFLWISFVPSVFFYICMGLTSETIAVMGFSSFIGILLFFFSINIVSLYLSIPRKFRDESKVLKLLKNKSKNYLFIYLCISSVLAIISANSGLGDMAYLGPNMLVIFLISMFFKADIGRYRLSAFTSAMELLKSRKQGGE